MRTGLGAVAVALTFCLAVLVERRWPLRRWTVAPARALARIGQNVTLGALGTLASASVDFVVARELAVWAESQGLGLVRWLMLPEPLRVVVLVAALDYSLWWWHKLNHTVPLLWRFHLVHHIDRDLDVSTGLRFHVGELASTLALRVVQVTLLGVDPLTLGAWQSLTTVSVLFHHSNLRLPAALDAALTRLVVTPRMHGVHHSDVPAETTSNYGSLLTVWDRLHGTLTLDVPQERITIGVREYPDAGDMSVGQLLALPVEAPRKQA